MVKSFSDASLLPDFPLWEKMRSRKGVVSFDLELTARCNNNCRHCYINLPVEDRKAVRKELTLEEISRIADEAISLGAFWCLLTGGEPLLRKDFFEIYLLLKRKGLLVSVFTNATLITKKHVEFFKKYPPRDIEVTVYGISQKTYEQITRVPGSFKAFRRGLELLLQGGIKVRFKAMAMRSNLNELLKINRFCRQRTKDYFRFDPSLHARFDGNKKRNREIASERLLPSEYVALEQGDSERRIALKKSCNELIRPEMKHLKCNHLFHCGTGNGNFTVGYDGMFRLCSSLHHPDCVYDLRKGTLAEAFQSFVPKVRDLRSNREVFLKKCRVCSIFNLCIWCPAHAHLETGQLDQPVDYFCELAHARAAAIKR